MKKDYGIIRMLFVIFVSSMVLGYSSLNVRDFGAKGDGKTDDSDSIQAAIDSAAAVDTGCCEVYIPKGLYYLGGRINLRSNIKIVGDGKNSSILKGIRVDTIGTPPFQRIDTTFSYDVGFFADTSVSNVYIGHLQIRDIYSSNPPTTERQGIKIYGASYITIEHCKFHNCDDSGLRIGPCFDGSVPVKFAEHCKALFNVVTNTRGGCGIEVIYGNNTLVQGNTISDMYQHGIRINGSTGVIANGNHIYRCSENGVSIQGSAQGTGNIWIRVHNVIVSGNYIENCKNGISLFNEARDILITGNTIFSDSATNTRKGIAMRHGNAGDTCDYGATRVEIIGNSMIGLNRGINMFGDFSRILIRGNSIKQFQSSSGSAYGIFLKNNDGTTEYDFREVFIEGNIIVDSLTGSYYGIGAFHYEVPPVHVYTLYNRISLTDTTKFFTGSAKAYLKRQLGSTETNTCIKYGSAGTCDCD